MKFLFPRHSAATSIPGDGRWLASAYGAAADPLVDGLPGLMARATKEARSPRTRPSATPAAPSTAAAELLDALTRLRSLTLSATLTGEDASRDLKLRAAMSVAIGAAHGLSLASSSQPTAGDLAHTWAGVNAVLVAAGRRGLTPDATPSRPA
jgi:hypothetical protein